MRDLIGSFILLLKDARGFKNKLIVFKYTLSHFGKRQPLDDIFVELKKVKIWFKPFTGELASYKEIYLNKDYESQEGFRARPADIIFDVGANIGLYAMRQAKRAGEGTVYAFEPNPSSFARLKKNAEANNLRNMVLFNKAVYSQRGEFELDVVSSTGTRTLPAGLRPTATVEGWTLDEVISKHPVARIDLMKIDVEGSEAEVLKGGKKCLEITERIVLEVHSEELENQVEMFLKQAEFNRVFQKKLTGTSILYFLRH